MNTEEIRLLTNAGYLLIVLYGMQGGFGLAKELIGVVRDFANALIALLKEFLSEWRQTHGLKKPEKESDKSK